LYLLCLLPAWTSAQEGPIQQVEIKASAAAYDARRDDTATKIVIGQEEILKNGDATLGDVLKRLPGVTIGGVQGRGGEIRMRGLGNGYTQILLNGEPTPPGFSLDALAPDLVERIEIMRSATAEYSTQAIAGTINIVLKRAIATAQREVKPSLRMDDGQPGTNINVQLSDRAGIYSYALGGTVQDNKQQRSDSGVTTITNPAGVETTRRNVANASSGLYQALSLAPRLNVNLGANDIVTSQSFLNAVRYRGRWDQRIATRFGALPDYSSAGEDVVDTTLAARTDLSWVHKMPEGAKLEMKAGVNYNHRTNDLDAQNFDGAGTLALGRLVAAGAIDKGVTASGKFSTPIGEGHALTSGWDSAWSERGESRLEHDRFMTGAPTAELDQAYAATVARIAVFAQDEWTISQQLSGYLGLRWEGIRTRSSGAGYAPVDNTSSVWSPLLQALYKFPGSKNDQVRLGLTRTYKAPGVASLIPRRINANNNTATTPDIQGNPALKPELAWGLDLAVEHYLEGGGLLSASSYLRRIRDNTRNNTFLIDGAWVSMPVNTGAAQARGIELEAKFSLRAWYKSAPAIDVRTNLARNWSTLDSVPGPNNRLVGQTPFSANLGLDYKSDRLPLGLGASVSFQNGGPVRFSENEFDYAGAKRVLDLYALFKFNPKNQLRLSMANALHQNNVSATRWFDATGALSDTTVTPTATVFRAILEMKL
jgi:outer membrane receptor protein involved in Fe transport